MARKAKAAAKRKVTFYLTPLTLLKLEEERVARIAEGATRRFASVSAIVEVAISRLCSDARTMREAFARNAARRRRA